MHKILRSELKNYFQILRRFIWHVNVKQKSMRYVAHFNFSTKLFFNNRFGNIQTNAAAIFAFCAYIRFKNLF